MDRPIILLRLPEEVTFKLQYFGFDSIEDIEKCLKDFGEIPKDLQNVFDEHKIFEKIKSYNSMSTIESANEKLSKLCSPIFIFHEGLAKLLDEGLPLGQITELCGPPGSGKTQMCLQFCVDVQIPQELGGSAGEALFISTDFGFHVERLRQICEGTIKHFAAVDYESEEIKQRCLNRLSVENLLNGVKVLRIHELSRLYAALEHMKNFFETNESIRLVVIDSFSMPMILDVQDSGPRTKIIAFFLSSLLNFAVKFKFAIVVTNQLMTIVSGKNVSCVKPSLGQAYAHRIHQRLLLRDNKAYLTKSVSKPQMFTSFKVTTDGLR